MANLAGRGVVASAQPVVPASQPACKKETYTLFYTCDNMSHNAHAHVQVLRSADYPVMISQCRSVYYTAGVYSTACVYSDSIAR